MIALVLLSLIGPFLAAGRLRAGTSLFSVLAFVSMIAPVATTSYDARYAIPLFALFGTSAALGAYAIWTTFASWSTRVTAH